MDDLKETDDGLEEIFVDSANDSDSDMADVLTERDEEQLERYSTSSEENKVKLKKLK